MKLIVGLGNPGKKYERTRHNIGFRVVDALLQHREVAAGSEPLALNQKQNLFSFGDAPVFGDEVIFAKPNLFMNESGGAVSEMLRYFSLAPNHCLLVVDDIHLPIGKLRFRANGSTGGHNGLESVIHSIGTQGFPRLRIGINKPETKTESDLPDHVLGCFSKAEEGQIRPQIDRACEACLAWLREDSEAVMQRFNG